MKTIQTEVARQKLRGQGLVEALVGLLLAVILIVAVLLPVTINVVNSSSASFTPTTATIAGQLQLLLAVTGVVIIAGTMAFFVRR